MANLDQILPIVNVLLPLVVHFVQSRGGASTIPEPNTPEYDRYLADLQEHIARRGDTVIAEIEAMQRAHPRTPTDS